MNCVICQNIVVGGQRSRFAGPVQFIQNVKENDETAPDSDVIYPHEENAKIGQKTFIHQVIHIIHRFWTDFPFEKTLSSKTCVLCISYKIFKTIEKI